MRNGAIAALLVVAILVGAGVGYLVGANASGSQTGKVVATTPNVFEMSVNGSFYIAADISSEIVVQNPGYAYFRNASVTFDGVKFETICLPEYSGCPVPSGSTTAQTVTVVGLRAYRFNMTFPDGTTETAGGVIGDVPYTFAVSNHAYPRAGMLIEYVTYNGNGSYHAFLLVSE